MPRIVDSLHEIARLEERVSSIHWDHMEAVRNITATARTPLEMHSRRADADAAFAMGFQDIWRQWRRTNRRVSSQNARAVAREKGRASEIAAREKFVVTMDGLLPLSPDNLQTAADALTRLNQELAKIRGLIEDAEFRSDLLDAEVDRQSEASNRLQGHMSDEDPSTPTSDVEQMLE